MINNPGTNLNAVPEEAAMNNSFPQANDNRRMNDKGADSLDINKGSMPVQANSDQMQTGGYYQPSKLKCFIFFEILLHFCHFSSGHVYY